MPQRLPPALSPEDQDALVAQADELLDRTLERIRVADEAIWEHQAQMGRTLITLAAGGIVVSISVAQLFVDRAHNLHWAWLLSACWISWTLSLLAGISREGWMGTARATAAYLERKRGEMRQQIRALRPDQTYDDYEKLIIDTLTEAEREPTKAVRVHDALNQVVYWTFAAGIVALVAFAVRNLPI